MLIYLLCRCIVSLIFGNESIAGWWLESLLLLNLFCYSLHQWLLVKLMMSQMSRPLLITVQTMYTTWLSQTNRPVSITLQTQYSIWFCNILYHRSLTFAFTYIRDIPLLRTYYFQVSGPLRWFQIDTQHNKTRYKQRLKNITYIPHTFSLLPKDGRFGFT